MKTGSRLLNACIIILISVLVLNGCFSKAPKVDKNSGSETNKAVENSRDDAPVPVFVRETQDLLADIAEDLLDLFSQPDDYELPSPDTFTNIRKEYNEGKISAETQAELFLLAVYAPELVPARYRGTAGPVESPQFATQFLVDNWEKLDQELKTSVTPFIVPVSDPASYWYPEIKAKTSHWPVFPAVSPAFAAEDEKVLVVHSFELDGIEVKIIYHEHSSWNTEQKLVYNMCIRDIEDAVRLGYERFRELLGLSLAKPLLIEFLPLQKNLNGLAWQEKSRYRIRLNTSQVGNPEVVSATTVHELFHAFQFAMNLPYHADDVMWLMEATATWAEHYVYDNFNTEHWRLPLFFRTLHQDRIGFGGLYEYSGYMPFYYLSDYAGKNIVAGILRETATAGPRTVREYLSEKVPGMKELYADYALCNINRYIFQRYDDNGPLPGIISGKALSKTGLKADDKKTKTVLLNPGALQYNLFFIDKNNRDIRHIDIYFDRRLDNDRYRTRLGIIRTYDGRWHYEDWSAAESVHFCRNHREDEIDLLFIVYVNADFKKEGADEPVDSFTIMTGRCPSGMEITVSAEFKYNVDGFAWESTAGLRERLKIVDHYLFLVESSDYHFSGKGEYEGRLLLESDGRYSMRTADADIHNSMARIIRRLSYNKEFNPEEFKAYGFKDNTPPGGMLILVPPLQENDNLQGSGKMHFSDPVGTIETGAPLPLDGLSQIVAIGLDEAHWTSEGFRLECEVDYFSYQSPLSGWFTVDFGKIMNMLPQQPDTGAATGGLDLGNISEYQGMTDQQINIPGMPAVGGLKEIGVLRNALLLSHKSPGGTAVIKLTVVGRYTE